MRRPWPLVLLAILVALAATAAIGVRRADTLAAAASHDGEEPPCLASRFGLPCR